MLTGIEDAQLEGTIHTRDEAINLLRELLKESSESAGQQVSESAVA